MNIKIEKARAHIEGVEVARIIQEFWHEFDGVYAYDTMVSNLCAVGPLQSMIGLAIANGHLSLARSQPTLKGEGE